MVGLERTAQDRTLGVQFYAERREDFDERLRLLSSPELFGPEASRVLGEETRTLVTIRADQQFLYQTLQLSAFVFFSPSDEDSYLRLSGEYKLSDELKVALGGNIFSGDAHTQFGNQREDDNVWVRIRMGF